MDADEAITGAASCRNTPSLEQIALVGTGFGNAKAVKGKSATRSVVMYEDMVGDANEEMILKRTAVDNSLEENRKKRNPLPQCRETISHISTPTEL